MEPSQIMLFRITGSNSFLYHRQVVVVYVATATSQNSKPSDAVMPRIFLLSRTGLSSSRDSVRCKAIAMQLQCNCNARHGAPPVRHGVSDFDRLISAPKANNLPVAFGDRASATHHYRHNMVENLIPGFGVDIATKADSAASTRYLPTTCRCNFNYGIDDYWPMNAHNKTDMAAWRTQRLLGFLRSGKMTIIDLFHRSRFDRIQCSMVLHKRESIATPKAIN